MISEGGDDRFFSERICNERKRDQMCDQTYKEQWGNPVVFSELYLKELLSLSGDVGGKKVMKQHLQDTFFGEAASGQELEDMDYAREARSVGRPVCGSWRG